MAKLENIVTIAKAFLEALRALVAKSLKEDELSITENLIDYMYLATVRHKMMID